jgi:hypothetical protein
MKILIRGTGEKKVRGTLYGEPQAVETSRVMVTLPGAERMIGFVRVARRVRTKWSL